MFNQASTTLVLVPASWGKSRAMHVRIRTMSMYVSFKIQLHARSATRLHCVRLSVLSQHAKSGRYTGVAVEFRNSRVVFRAVDNVRRINATGPDTAPQTAPLPSGKLGWPGVKPPPYPTSSPTTQLLHISYNLSTPVAG
jgi:hypothetical protein